MIKIIITDEQPLIRIGFRTLLSTVDDIIITGEASNALELNNLLRSKECDIVVMGINLPDKHFLEVVKDITLVYPSVKILILSSPSDISYSPRALKDGAHGYITTNSSIKELLCAIRKISSGEIYISDRLVENLAYVISDRYHPLHDQLSDREYEVLLSIGTGESANEIAERLSLSVNTVHTYRRRILKKLNLHSTAELVHYVISNKLIEE